ncbi:50S ribosomal protein L21 [Mycoplasma haemocanis str. Illinois]|uniref:Large ribosomal subunit protein bL21 n=1 Tax=Mycoplasma haemocanis (strain Illinois) TaxID=1111676 RepID=H6N7U0_MYCHN|nr:50S ribosomal protein L21 [Mycoplasma haemocanis]AEW45712.1 50S ribosomal protein L21 [Mycoplasma haemocanis str. Illinois]
MIAYFCLAGKQYMAKVGDVLENCPHIKGEVGEKVISNEVMGIDTSLACDMNTPYLVGATVELRIVKQGKAKKLRVVKFISQKRHKRWKGHRTMYTNLEVLGIHWSK